jgi:hypothetical protein
MALTARSTLAADAACFDGALPVISETGTFFLKKLQNIWFIK